MEKKIKHRILGILVIIGLIVISLPLFQNQHIQSETTLVKTPPFPDPTYSNASIENQPTKPFETTPLQNKESLNQQPDDTIRAIKPSIVNNVPMLPLSFLNQAKVKEKSKTAPDEMIETPSVSFDNKHVIITGSSLTHYPKNEIHHISANKITSSKTVPDTHQTFSTLVNKDNLIGTKNTAWAIQLGSFKDKRNALRLVNHLRENGYRAFIRQISTSFGENTRVYVGPELKRTLVHQLTIQLENDLHIKGIIVRYQPVSL